MSNLKLNLASGEILYVEREGGAEESMSSVFTASQILEAIKAPNIIPRYRIFVLYPDETINYEIPIEDIQSGGSYSENYQDGQRRSLNFSLINNDGKYLVGINKLWEGTRLRLDLGVQNYLGTTIWVEKGIFVITKANCSEDNSGNKITQITAGDKFMLFEGKTGVLDDTTEIPVGSKIRDVITSILVMDPGNGFPFDQKPIIYNADFQGKTVQSSISKSAGDTYGSILLELGTQLSSEVFYNSQGNLTFIPTTETTSDNDKPLLCEVEAEKGDYDSLSFDIDFSSIVNKIIVTGSSNSSSSEVYKAVAVNDDPKSPLCYQRIGYHTGSVINDSNITSNILAKERAEYELRKVLMMKSSVSFNIAFNPLVTVNNLISVTNPFFEMTSKRFLIQSVSCSLDYSGTMSLSLTSLDNMPFLSR